MSDKPRIGLDNPAFQGRLRQPDSQRAGSSAVRHRCVTHMEFTNTAKAHVSAPKSLKRVPAIELSHKTVDVAVKPKPIQPSVEADVPVSRKQALKPLEIINPQPFAKPAHPKQQRSQVLHRRAVQKNLVPDIATGLKSYSKMQLGLVAMAGFIFLVGVIVSIITLQTNNTSKAQVAALSSKAETSNDPDNAPPSETKPTSSQKAAYRVAPLLPKYIAIDAIDVDARVLSMGINKQGELQAPTSIHDAGWYNASAKPGDSAGNGAVLIDGHVHGPTLPGVFTALKRSPIGSSIRITRGDNKVITYKVVKVQNYDAKTFDMGLALQSAQPGVAGLNVITCGGQYDKVSGEYEERTIVFAVQVS